MATNHGHGTADEPRNPSVGYDKSDLGARGILIFFLVLAVFAVCINFVVLGMYAGMIRFAEKHDVEASPLAPQTVTPRSEIMMNTANVNIQKFPEPRLQDDDTREMQRLRMKETAALTAEPWQDTQGNEHLPIEQAMKTVVTQLPVRAGSAAVPNYPGVEYTGSAGSGPQVALGDAVAKQDEQTHGEGENSPAAK